MGEKATFMEFIQTHKKKIIIGAVIVVGAVTGIIIMNKLLSNSEQALMDEIADVIDGLPDNATKDNIVQIGKEVAA